MGGYPRGLRPRHQGKNSVVHGLNLPETGIRVNAPLPQLSTSQDFLSTPKLLDRFVGCGVVDG